MAGKMRVKQAADYLNVTPQTVRNWNNSGDLPCDYNGAGQRIFSKEDLDTHKRNRIRLEPIPEPLIVFYIRTSNKQDISLENQRQKLIQSYGNPDEIFTDVGSGLNDNRKGLNKLITYLEKSSQPVVVHITNKDRLTRFGFRYLERFFHNLNTEIVVLDSDDTKETHEVLMQDFMSLLASFSGKFYRLRGWEQRKKILG